MYSRILKWLVVLASIITIVINLMSDVILIGGKTTAQISDSFKVFFVPAGYVFAIWGIIYVGLMLYSFYQLSSSDDRVLKIAPWYILSCIANCAWIFLWHYESFALTIVFMIILLLCLIVIYLKLNDGKKVDSKEKNMVYIPFSIYLGWICVATIANITIYLESIHFNIPGIQPQVLSAILILISFLLGFVFLIKYRDYAFPLVIVWATLGIGVKFNGVDSLVSSAGFAAGVTLLIAVVIRYLQLRNKTV